MRIEVTPHTRSLSNFSEFTYTVLQAGSISEKSCAQVVASPRYSEPQRKNIDTSIAMSPCRHAGAPDYHHWCDFNTGSVGSQLAIVRTLEAYTCTYMYCTRLYGSCVGYPPRGYEAIEVRYSSRLLQSQRPVSSTTKAIKRNGGYHYRCSAYNVDVCNDMSLSRRLRACLLYHRAICPPDADQRPPARHDTC